MNTLQQVLPTAVKALVAAAALLIANTAALAEQTPWKIQEQDDGIFIYSRSVEGSSYNAIKATMLIDSSMDRLSKLIGDGNGCPEWRAMCKFSEVIEDTSEHERYVYTVLDLPWPASDRDMVLHTKTQIDGDTNTATVHLSSDSTRHPAADYVRAETSGRMIIHAVSDRQVEFTYIMHTELGGSLPASSVNAGLIDGALVDLKRLRQLAEG